MSSGSKLTAESSAVQAHLGMMQDIIRRMADNSRSCKLWCVTLVAAMLVLMGGTEHGHFVWVALIPAFFLGVLDVYYLFLEKRFRISYEGFVTMLHRGNLNESDMFVIDPGGTVAITVWRSVMSLTILPFYIPMIVAVLLAALFLGRSS